MSCNGCYEKEIQSCDDIKLKAGLTANTDYYVLVQKPQKNNVYQRKLTSDSGGIITIPESIFPEGYLIEGSYLNIEVRDSADYLTKKQLTFGGVAYDCALIKLVDFDLDAYDASPVNVIQ